MLNKFKQPSAAALEIASKIIVKDGLDIRIKGASGTSKLLARFDTDHGLNHRLENARMLLAGWVELLSAGPLDSAASQIEFLQSA